MVLVSEYNSPRPFNTLMSNCLKVMNILKTHGSQFRSWNPDMRVWLYLEWCKECNEFSLNVYEVFKTMSEFWSKLINAAITFKILIWSELGEP